MNDNLKDLLEFISEHNGINDKAKLETQGAELGIHVVQKAAKKGS